MKRFVFVVKKGMRSLGVVFHILDENMIRKLTGRKPIGYVVEEKKEERKREPSSWLDLP